MARSCEAEKVLHGAAGREGKIRIERQEEYGKVAYVVAFYIPDLPFCPPDQTSSRYLPDLTDRLPLQRRRYRRRGAGCRFGGTLAEARTRSRYRSGSPCVPRAVHPPHG